MGLVMLLFEMRALTMFPFFSNIKALNRSVVAHNPCVDQTFTAFLLILLQDQQLFFCITCHSIYVC